MRSYITALCAETFKSGEIPVMWKTTVTILRYKKGPMDNPENFHPILLNMYLKILTTILHDKIRSFLMNNGYIETHIQKGFVAGMSGTFEHLSHLTKQRSLTVTLIDLCNAFGQVSHDLIISTLKFHHMPPEIIAMIQHYVHWFLHCKSN